MYSFLAAWLLLATYAYVRGSTTGKNGWWIIFAIAAAFAQYTHNLAIFYLAPLAITPILQRDWKSFRAIILAGAGSILLYLPWLVQLPAQFSRVEASYWTIRPEPSQIFTLLIVFVTNLPLPNNWLFPALFIALMIATIGVLQTIRATKKENAHKGRWILYLSFTPPLLLFLFSQWIPVYIERALLPSGAMFIIWIAWVLTHTNLPRLVHTFVLVMFAIASIMGIYQHMAYKDFPYGPFRALDTSLRARFRPGDVIIHSNKLSLLPAIYFDRTLPQSFIIDTLGSPEDTLAYATQQVLGVNPKPNIQVASDGVSRIWYVIYQRSIDEFQASGYITPPDLEYLNTHYMLEAKEAWDDIVVYRFARKP